MMMMDNTPVSLHSCQRFLLISSILATALHSFASLALAQTPASGPPNLESSWLVSSEPSVFSTRHLNFSPTQPTILVSTTSESQLGSVRHMQSPQTTTTTATQYYRQQQTQPKSLKFTLTAGKYWKFNIKTNSLQTNIVEKELRLHKNVSAGNYIIDDDGWFQYNHQQQQLFAWPSLSVKPATYYFVLLPSGLDYESDGENVINIGDVVANIVVELIRPYVGVGGASSRLDLDQLIDYKLSLESLHRHSSYPLLLTQIVSVFDLLSKAATTTNISPANNDQNSSIPPQSTITTTTSTTSTLRSLVTTSAAPQPSSSSTIATAILQNKQARLAGKFSEFLLIDSSATPDGEFFSITWTTHPTLINNTIVPINECRLSMINDTVLRLSSRSILYPVVDDKFVISYALEGPLVNSQAIIPTERGNYALKLSLHNACKNKRVIDELGVTSAKGFPIDTDDKDNNIPVGNASSLKSLSIETPGTTVGTEIASNEQQADKQETGQDQEHVVEPTQVTTENTPVIAAETHHTTTSSISSTLATLEAIRPKIEWIGDPSLQPVQTTQTTTDASSPISARSTDQLATGWPPPSPPESQPTPDPLLQIQSSIRRPLGASALPTTTSEQNQKQQQPKLQPQAKSFENFLDSVSDITMNTTTTLNNTMTEVTTPQTSLAGDPTMGSKAGVVNASNSSQVTTIGKGVQETSLNDDLIGILNEITELMVSIAIPLAVVLGIVLIVSILIAICNLCIKKRKSKQFEVSDRFKFRYGSERKGFLKKSSKPVILEADQKSLSMGGTPRHQPLLKGDVKAKTNMIDKKKRTNNSHATNSSGSDFFAMSHLTSAGTADSGHCSGAGDFSGHCGGDGGDFGGI